jgi:hypothetical protein
VGDLRRVPKAGGAAETVVSGIDVSGGGLGFGALAATGGLVYVASNSGVSRWNESTTTLETIHAEPAAELRVDDAGQYVYWTTTDPTTYKAGIHRQLSSGGSIEEIVAGEPAVQSFAVDATHVYYAGNHEIDRVPLAGGTTETVLLTDTAVRIEIAGDFIYWLSFDKADFGTVHRVAKTGGTDEVLGSGDVGLNALAVDSAHIYFADGSGNGGLVSVDLQTKTAYPLETGVLYTHVLVADGEYVYIKDVLGVRRTLKWP